MPRNKRKQRSYRKVRRTPKSSKRLYADVRKLTKDPVLKKKWDNKKTVLQNVANIFVSDFIDTLPEDLSPPEPKQLSETEVCIMAKLYKKHQEDLQAMFRDIKTNIYQWTQGQLKNKLQLYKQSLE